MNLKKLKFLYGCKWIGERSGREGVEVEVIWDESIQIHRQWNQEETVIGNNILKG